MSDFEIISVYPSVSPYVEEDESSNSVSNAYDEARAAIAALNLGDSGYSYIEEACLNELAELEAQECELNSYSVILPKARASTPTSCGTINGTTLYSSTISIAEYNVKLKPVTREDLIAAFFNGAANIIVTVSGQEVISAAWTAFSVFAGIPVTQLKTETLEMKYGVRVAATNRAIYVNVLGGYKNLYNQHFGDLRGYVETYNDINATTPGRSGWTGAKYTISDPFSKVSEKSKLLNEAYQVYLNNLPALTFTLDSKAVAQLTNNS